MELDLPMLAPSERFTFLTSVVVPRPIAWVTTRNAEGVVNAAPFSFFNVFGSKPGMVVLGIGNRPDTGEAKDTALNIRASGEFVVNSVTEELAEKMVKTSGPYPFGDDELKAVGLEAAPSKKVAPPRIAASPVALECVHTQTIEIGGNRLIVGEIIHAYIDDEFYDSETGRARTDTMRIVGRMHGSDGYLRSSDFFEIQRPS